MYCTPVNLADARLSRELAQVATPERSPIVADDLMEAVLRGGDVTGFDPADVVVATQALVHIQEALRNADGVIDGYLRMRKPRPYTVPLAPVPEIVSVWGRWIARYLLHKDRVDTREETDPIVRDYRQAIKFLEAVRDGKFSLGADDPLDPPSSGSPEACHPERQFTMGTLRDFGQ